MGQKSSRNWAGTGRYSWMLASAENLQEQKFVILVQIATYSKSLNCHFLTISCKNNHISFHLLFFIIIY
jgi:hypothetical protein